MKAAKAKAPISKALAKWIREVEAIDDSQIMIGYQFLTRSRKARNRSAAKTPAKRKAVRRKAA